MLSPAAPNPPAVVESTSPSDDAGAPVTVVVDGVDEIEPPEGFTPATVAIVVTEPLSASIWLTV